MLNRLLFWKEGPRPSLCFVLALACLIVALPIQFYPQLYNVFGGLPRYYPWQFLTCVFAHGSYLGPLPLLVHLAVNLTILLVFGGAIERLVGTRRFALLSGTALLIYMALRHALYSWGNGISGVTWAYTPFALYLLVSSLQHDRDRCKRDPTTYVFAFVLITAWVIITVGSHHMRLRHTNLYHMVAVAVGVPFVFCWRRLLHEGLTREVIESPKHTRAGQWIVHTALIIPLASLVILILSLAGVVSDHSSSATVTITPASGSIEQINELGGRIVVSFSEPMSERYSAQTHFHSSDGRDPLSAQTHWVNDQTLVFAFSRYLTAGERLEIELSGLMDATGLRLFERYHLIYASAINEME